MTMQVIVPLGAFEPVEILSVLWQSEARVRLRLRRGFRIRTLIVTAAGYRAIAAEMVRI